MLRWRGIGLVSVGGLVTDQSSEPCCHRASRALALPLPLDRLAPDRCNGLVLLAWQLVADGSLSAEYGRKPRVIVVCRGSTGPRGSSHDSWSRSLLFLSSRSYARKAPDSITCPCAFRCPVASRNNATGRATAIVQRETSLSVSRSFFRAGNSALRRAHGAAAARHPRPVVAWDFPEA
jgi:hypothetical protein